MTDINPLPPNNPLTTPVTRIRFTRLWIIGFSVLSLLMLVLLYGAFAGNSAPSKPWSVFRQAIQAYAIEQITVYDDGTIIGRLRGNLDPVTGQSTTWQTSVPPTGPDSVSFKEIDEMCAQSGTKCKYEATNRALLKLLAIITFCSMLLWLIAFLVVRQWRTSR